MLINDHYDGCTMLKDVGISTSKLRKKWSLTGDSTFLAGLAVNVQKFWTVVLCNQTSTATRG